MSKQDLQAKLDELGVDYDGRWGEKRLQSLLDDHVDEVVDEIVDEVVEEEKPRPVIQNVHEEKSIRPLKDKDWLYVVECSQEVCSVYKQRCRGGITYSKGREHIRDYTLERHGENFASLAEQFAGKNNR